MIKGTNKIKYYPYLDGLRAIAAIYVVLHHTISQFNFDYPSLNFIEKYSIISFFYGHLAVDFFIVLSGFCLTIPIVNANSFKLKNGIVLFYKRRIRRIVFPYFLALIFSLVLIKTLVGVKTGRHWDSSLPVSTNDVITHFLLIQDVFSSSMFKINHALWTISVECRIYLFFPLLLLIWRKFSGGMMLLTTLLISMFIFISTAYLNYFFNLKIERGLDGVNPYIILFVVLF